MHVLVVSDGENLPVQANARVMRTGMLIRELRKRSHTVNWVSSTFSHQRKTLVSTEDADIDLEPGLRLSLVHAGGYRRNLSLQRYIQHRRLARRFRERVGRLSRPDVVVCAFPPIDLAYETVNFAKANRIPVVVDVRDLWPDSIVEEIPRSLRALAKLALARDFRRTRAVAAKADSLVSISEGCLDWGLRYAGRPRTNADRIFYTSYPQPRATEADMGTGLRELTEKIEGKVVLTYVGSFGNAHEVELVCEVARRMSTTSNCDAHFVLAGNGEKFASIEKAASALPNVSLTGWLNEGQLAAVLALSHVGLLPWQSVADAMPNKLFEYLSAGLPVVSSLRGDAEAMIAEHEVGFSYLPGDSDALAGHILRLARDRSLRERQARNARELFLREFQPEVVYGNYASHVESLASGES